MTQVIVDRDAKADIMAIAERDPESAAELLVTLQEFEADPDAFEALSDERQASERVQSVGPVQSLLRQGYNLWRCRIYVLSDLGGELPYRILYAVVPTQRMIRVLGIAHRSEIDYDRPNRCPHLVRVARRYQDLGLPTLPR